MKAIEIKGLKLESMNRLLRGTSRGARMAAANKAKRERTLVNQILRGQYGTAPKPPLVITIIRVGPRELDSDNLAASAKHVRDGVADWFGIDDKDKRLKWEYKQEKGAPKTYSVKVQIERWEQSLGELLACDKTYQDLVVKSLKLAAARANLEPGTSRARVTTANAKWARAAEARELRLSQLRAEWERAQ